MSDTQKHDAVQGRIVHVYDGIEEADNQLPLWWLATFFITIAFSVIYWEHYHIIKSGKLPTAAYEEQMAKTAGTQVSEDQLLGLSKEEQSVAEGKALFATHCLVCHEADGRGKIGPNLTDSLWIHGGSGLDIYKTVSEGVLTKGMPAWGQVLGPLAVQRLTAFVITMRGKNIAGKPAEGTPWPQGSDTK